MRKRLPSLPRTSDAGFVYVVERGGVYKIGFSRASVERRARDAEGVLLLVIPTGQRPSALEHVIHQRFGHKRVSDAELWGREWFVLDAEDLRWLRGLARFTRGTVQHSPSDNYY